MNPIEKIFEQLWPRKIKNNSQQKNQQQMSAFINSLEIFASSLFSSNFQPTIVLNEKHASFKNEVIYLPTLTPEYLSVERAIYLNLILQLSAAYHLRLFSQRSDPNSQIIDHLSHIGKTNLFLDEQFPGYFELQKTVYETLATETKNPLLDFWLETYLKRELNTLTPGELLPMDKINSNKYKLPECLLLTVPALCSPSQLQTILALQEQKTNKNTAKNKQSEQKKLKSSQVELIDLDKEQANPVMHSFEKLETADEYQGGYRTDSGDDELQEHSNALEELDLNKVTRGGEAAQSIYHSDHLFFQFTRQEDAIDKSAQAILYPEWHAKRKQYLDDYCQLFESQQTANSNNSPSMATEYKQKILQKFLLHIDYWRQRIQALQNQFLWLKRQKDGEEIDYDAFVREFPALLSRKNIDDRWYESKSKTMSETSIIILFDQSMSSDAWVANKRVLDVITESLALSGLLFEDVFNDITVAGTWSETRKKCHFHIYKKSTQPWIQYFAVAESIEPIGYTRLGPAIRHATQLLTKKSSQKKLLLLLTDGKPTDLDGYEGIHGLADVKQACLEAAGKGILPFALTIDHQAKQYFPKMFKHYQMLHEPSQLAEAIYLILLKLMKGDSL